MDSIVEHGKTTKFFSNEFFNTKFKWIYITSINKADING